MRAGLLRHRLELQEPDTIPDALNGTIPNPGGDGSGWKKVASVPANVEPLDGSELFEGDAVRSNLTHRVTIRGEWVALVKPTHSFLFGERRLVISRILNTEERNRELVVYCREASL